MSKETWIVVANSTVARVFRLDKLHLKEMDSLIHPESRMRDQDLIEGEVGSAVGLGSRKFMMARSSQPPKKIEAEQFAKQVVQYIGSARIKGSLERLFLAASPSFLGLLRGEMDSHTAQLIAHEISKDITHLEPEEIKGYFPIGV